MVNISSWTHHMAVDSSCAKLLVPLKHQNANMLLVATLLTRQS